MNDRARRRTTLKRRTFYAVALVLLKAIDISLRVLGYRRTCRCLLFCSPRPDPAITDFPRTIATARHVHRIVAHRLGNTPCLRRSLLLWWILRWRRIPSDLRIGVNRDGGHAWVEHHGQVVNDWADVAERYSVIYTDRLSPEGVSSER